MESQRLGDPVFVNALGQKQYREKAIIDEGTTPQAVLAAGDAQFVQGEAIPAKAKSFNQLLTSTTVENLLANGGNIIALQVDDTIESALQVFKDAEIQAAPVYDAGGNFVRILNLTDIFYYFCGIQQDSLEGFLKQKVDTLWANDNMTQESPLVPIGTTLAEVTKSLATGKHHVGILDKFTNSMFNIISQLAMVEFIAKNISLLPRHLRDRPVQDFMKQIIHVNTVPSDTSTRESFEYLFTDKISAAAVVNRLTGTIMDTISTTDIVGVLYDRFKYLDRPVVEFLNATRRTKAIKPPITCRGEDTLEYVIMKLASTGVHRLWVVDSETQLLYLGLVNLTNVLEVVSSVLD
jgi:CBS-domain-containing membrane protein